MRKLLVIDDDVSVRKQILEYFRMEFNAVGAGNSDEAWRLFNEQDPDVVFLDYELRGSSLQGGDLLKAMKEKCPRVLIVMITGNSDRREELLGQGADYFFDKPFSIKEIEKVLKENGH